MNTGVLSDRVNIRLTMALSDYDHVRDLVSGRVDVEGVDLTCLTLPVEEIFFRFVRHREWHVSELSLGKYTTLRAQGDESLIAIPVFPSRCFRHSAIFVRPDGPVDDPSALRGGRIGIPEWTVTATVYARALLHHDYGVEPADVRWIQAGTIEPGRVEGLAVEMAPGVTVERVADRSLNDMLIAGDLDALIAPHPPDGLLDGSGQIVRLFSDTRSVEAEYHRRTGIFPIMHVVVLRADVYAEHPWVAMSLFKAFEQAKRRSIERVVDDNASRVPVPWGATHAQQIQAEFGGDLWPYGVEPNRVTLEAFLGFAHEQGLSSRRLEPEELFAPEVLSSFRV
jgi:4,5-dihydroxyphthalate decarboxylase